MRRRLFWLPLAAFVGLVVGLAARPLAQTELDRVVVRVGGRAITRSEIRLARALKLVGDSSSDEACQRQLEDRLLALGEVTRLLAGVTVGDDAVAARRTQWEQGLGGGDPARKLLAQYEMSDAELSTWFRDDLRVATYLDRQFGTLPAADRAKATSDWFARLRQRADLR
jgi:hypothetical protein